MAIGRITEQIEGALSQHSPPAAAYAVRLFGQSCRGAPEIARVLSEYCEKKSAAPLELLFGSVSQGAVFGLALENGEKIVVKVHAPTSPREHLARAYELQDALRGKGLPCAPLAIPLEEIAPGVLAVAHQYFAPGAFVSSAVDHRAEIARGLHELIEKGRTALWVGLQTATDRFYEMAAQGPTALRDLVMNAKETAVSSDAPLVAFHGDWKVRNLLFQNGRISAIYDFDSLMVGPEALAVGATAVDYMSPRGRSEMSLDPRQALAFVQEYQNASGRSFSQRDMEVVRAGAVTRLSMKVLHYKKAGVAIGGLPEAVAAFAAQATRIIV